jgi:molecular chaperone DnaK
MAVDNKSLGKFILDGIPPAPRGVPQIEVTFDIDANGILNVSARDKATGREQKITITASSGLAEQEIEQMIKEAEQHASDDAKRKELVEVKNQADSAVFSADKLLKDYGDRLPEDAKAVARERMEAVRQAMEGEDAARIKSATEALSEHLQSLGASMYQEADGAAQPGADEGGTDDGEGQQGEDVVDAEFTDA